MIEVRDLHKYFGEVKAVEGVSFSVPERQVYGLLGPNGAGKSTTIGVLAGLVQPTSGSASVAGFDVGRQSRQAKHHLGFVPQDVVLYEELNARENLAFFGGLYGLRGAGLKQRIDELLEITDLTQHAKRAIGTYSGGMKRRLNLACGLVHQPRVLLLDEPTVGIDPQARNHILGLVRDISQRGTTILYTTHYLHEAEELCDRIAIIDHGHILIEGTLEELRNEVGERDLVTIRGSFDANRTRENLAKLDSAEVLVVENDKVVLACRHGTVSIEALSRALHGAGETSEFSLRQPNLENLFIKLTGRELRE